MINNTVTEWNLRTNSYQKQKWSYIQHFKLYYSSQIFWILSIIAQGYHTIIIGWHWLSIIIFCEFIVVLEFKIFTGLIGSLKLIMKVHSSSIGLYDCHLYYFIVRIIKSRMYCHSLWLFCTEIKTIISNHLQKHKIRILSK